MCYGFPILKQLVISCRHIIVLGLCDIHVFVPQNYNLYSYGFFNYNKTSAEVPRLLRETGIYHILFTVIPQGQSLS